MNKLLTLFFILFCFTKLQAQLTFSAKWVPSELVFNGYINMNWDETQVGEGVVSVVNSGRDVYNIAVEPVNRLALEFGRHQPVDSLQMFDPEWDVQIGKGTQVRSLMGIGFAGSTFEAYTLFGQSETNNDFPFLGWEATLFPIAIFTDAQVKELLSIGRLLGVELRANLNSNDPFLFEWGWGLSANLDLALIGERVKVRGYYRLFREMPLIKGPNSGLLRTQALGLALAVNTTNRKTQGQRLPIDIWAGVGTRFGKISGPPHVSFSEKAIKSAGNTGLEVNELAYKAIVQLGNKVGYEVNLDTTIERLNFDTVPGIDGSFSETFFSLRLANDEKFGRLMLDLQLTNDKRFHVDGYLGIYPLAFLSVFSENLEDLTKPKPFFFAKWFPRKLVNLGLAATFYNKQDPDGFRELVRVGPYAELRLPIYFTRNFGVDLSAIGRRFVSRKDGEEGPIKYKKTDYTIGLHAHVTLAKINSQEKDLLEAYDLYDKDKIKSMNKRDKKGYKKKKNEQRKKRRTREKERKKKRKKKK